MNVDFYGNPKRKYIYLIHSNSSYYIAFRTNEGKYIRKTFSLKKYKGKKPAYNKAVEYLEFLILIHGLPIDKKKEFRKRYCKYGKLLPKYVIYDKHTDAYKGMLRTDNYTFNISRSCKVYGPEEAYRLVSEFISPNLKGAI